MAVQELRQITRERSKYFLKWWNWISTAMLMGFLIAGLFFLVGLAVSGGWSVPSFATFQDRTGCRLLLLGNCCFSIASVISIFYLGSLCQVNSMLGPLELSTIRMFKDITKFLMIFLGVFVAFSLGVRNLYSYNQSLQNEINLKRNITVDSAHKLGTSWDATQTMFWAMFDQANLEQFEIKGEGFEITRETGKFLFGLFLICAVLVGINMLVAMMNNSFEYITKDDDFQDWKVSRTSLWLEYIGKDTYHLPPPYNMIQSIFCTFKYCVKKRCKGETLSNEALNDNQRDDRKETVDNLIHRYLENVERKRRIQDLEEKQTGFLEALKECSKQKDGRSTSLYLSNV